MAEKTTANPVTSVAATNKEKGVGHINGELANRTRSGTKEEMRQISTATVSLANFLVLDCALIFVHCSCLRLNFLHSLPADFIEITDGGLDD